MGIYLIYFCLILLANTIGALAGMGGGVIIKPVLDGIGYHGLKDISYYASVAVFTMAMSATVRQLKNGIQIKWSIAFLMSIGSAMGGVAGEKLFNWLVRYFQQDSPILLMQVILTTASLFFVLYYTSSGHLTFELKSPSSFILVGILLGSFSTLMGIGGGPINVTVLIICFGLTLKDATVYSIIVIFFSQLSRLLEIGLSTGFQVYDNSFLLVVIPAALLGGFLGGLFSGWLNEERVSQLFKWVVILVILLNLFNGLKLLN